MIYLIELMGIFALARFDFSGTVPELSGKLPCSLRVRRKLTCYTRRIPDIGFPMKYPWA